MYVQSTDGRIKLGPAEVARQYLTRRADLGLDCSASAALLLDLDGEPIPAGQLRSYFVHARTVRVAVDANGSLLEQRKAARQTIALEELHWDFDTFCYYGEERLIDDLFLKGYVDVGIFNSTYLQAFYKNGFNTHEQNNQLKEKYPDRSVLTGRFDPREGEAGLDRFRQMVEEYPIEGLKLYTAEWYNGSKGWRLTDDMAYTHLELCEELGVKNMHVHKGPTVYPLSRDAFDVHDVDYAATDFPNLNFIVEHVGLPRLEDFCWIATQEQNVYAGLSVAMPFIHPRPRYFAEIIANLLFWVGEDKILFGSDYAIWDPGGSSRSLWPSNFRRTLRKSTASI